MWIEIFKSGTHTDSNGNSESYSEEALDRIAEIYNGRINKSSSDEAPLVKGHPKTDEPAFGWVERLARRGDVLLAKLKNVSNDLINEVHNGLYKKVSIALYPDLMLRHVGLLGAMPPAVKGLRNVSFQDNVEYKEFALDGLNNENELSTNTEFSQDEIFPLNIDELKVENKKLKDELIKKDYEIEVLKKESRLKEFREFANSLIDNPERSIITPAQSETLIDMLEMAYQREVSDSIILGAMNTFENNQFSNESSNVHKVKSFFSQLKPQFSRNEFAVKNRTQAITTDFKPSPNISAERLQLHEKAKEIQSETPGISYEEAVTIAQKEAILNF